MAHLKVTDKRVQAGAKQVQENRRIADEWYAQIQRDAEED